MAKTQIAALLLVGLGLAAAQNGPTSNVTVLNPPSNSNFSPDPSQVASISPPSSIYMMTPQNYAGPWNMSYIVSSPASAGVVIKFPDMAMAANPMASYIRVSSCFDATCTGGEVFLGMGMANGTLRTDREYAKIEFFFNDTVDQSWFPVTLEQVATCSVALNATCVADNAGKYGCIADTSLNSNVPITLLSPMDPCYGPVVTEQCLTEACMMCNTYCMDPTATVPAMCMGVCNKQNKPDDYCAPSCVYAQLGDMTCNPECNNPMCYFDGGDCITGLGPKSDIVTPHGIYGQMLDSADKNMDGMVSYEEFKAFPFNVPPLTMGPNPMENDMANMQAFEMADSDHNGGLDLAELAARAHMMTIDRHLDSQVTLDVIALTIAQGIVVIGDANMDGMIDDMEVRAFGLDGVADVDMIKDKGLFAKDQPPAMMPGMFAAEDLAHILFGIFVSLSGRTLSDPPFDNVGATHAAVMLFDHDHDLSLNMGEAGMMGLSRSLFEAIDSDDDHYLSEKELVAMQTMQMASGCAGTKLLMDRESEVKTMAPLTGTEPRRCSFLMMPDWFYAMGPIAKVQNPVHPLMGSRRLLSVEAPAKAAVQSVVMTRKSGPVPNHHLLSAKPKEVPHVHHSGHARRLLAGHETMATPPPLAPGGDVATQLDMGMEFNVTAQEMPWLVSVTTWNNMTMMMEHKCTGALIHPKYVIIPASCSARAMMPGDMHVVFHDMSMAMSAKVHVHPISDARGNAPSAIVELDQEKMMATTVQLHDGAGLDLSKCRQPVVAVGVMPMTMYPLMTKQAVRVVDAHECMQEHAGFNRISAVSGASVCAKPRNRVPKKCFDAMDDSILLAPHPENPRQYVVVGLRTWEGVGAVSCRVAGLPSAYTHVAGSLTWILSLPTFGKFPPQLLSVEIDQLSITDGQMVHVVTGSEMAGHQSGAIETKCSLGGTYWDDDALGSLMVTIDAPPSGGYFKSEIVLDFDVSSCGSGDIPAMKPGSPGADCETLRGCRAVPGVPAMCVAPMCEFSKDWKNVTKELQAHGKAFTGGLGGEAEVNGAVEYRQWMCARDWDVKEQLACNVGPGELACFRFEERSDEFVDFGRNFHKKIVSGPKQMQGVGKEKRGLTQI